ncbi:MAG: GPP34 family phosphoprotein [Acidobacteriia bacterium]|nr:GPP34 family phosphoprotein [Terriglobia bacterium]
MLTMLEEVVLLAVDEKTGTLRSTREFGTAYALVGAVFFDLALARKIDTDTEQIQILDASPTGNPTLDRVLTEMRGRPEVKTVRNWIEALFQSKDDLEGQALASLIERGILLHEKTKRLWIIDVERFPLVNNQPQEHVKLRLTRAILGDGIPETRDIMLVSLAEPCGLLGFFLTDMQRAVRGERIRMLCHLETISRKVAEAIAALDASLRQGGSTSNAAQSLR